jgi:hypothetical protein
VSTGITDDWNPIMKRLHPITMFTCGCFTALILTRTAPALLAQQGGDSDTIRVCAESGGTLRMIPLSGSCPSGQRSMLLKKKLLEEPEAPEPSADGKTSELDKQRIKELEDRLKELESSSSSRIAGNRVVAPFEVVDRNGRRIFYVAAEGGPPRAELYNAAGKLSAMMAALDSGGQFTTRSSDAAIAVYMGIFSGGKSAGLSVLEGGTKRIDLGKDDANGRFRLKFFRAGGSVVAGIGEEATTGTGLAVVADQSGNTRAAMGANGVSGKGYLVVSNAATTQVATLTEGERGAGFLQITNSGGTSMVQAGVNEGGYGVVSTGPSHFNPGLGVFGLPSSYIAGKK